MIKKFHDIDISLNDYIKDRLLFIKCYIRKIEILLTPEEEVRQAFLKAVHENLYLDVEKFTTRVEFQNLDIAFYYNYNNIDFQPTQNPFLIVETKRDYTTLLNHKNQIVNYLKLNFCETGFLLTSNTIYLVKYITTDYQHQRVGIESVKKIFNEKKPNIEKDIEHFNNAKKGIVDDFIYLSKKFNTSKITFLCADYSAPITAFLFFFDHEHILFDICGATSRKKKHKIKINSFLRLISINE